MSNELHDAYEPPVKKIQDDSGISIEVDVFIGGVRFDGYYTERSWWVHYGGDSVGSRRTSADEIDGWKYKL